MAIFRKLTQFLRTPEAPKGGFVPDESFSEFMNCHSLPDALKVVCAHPGLLGDKTLNMLVQLRAESDAKIKDPLPAEFFRQRVHWIQGFRDAEVLIWPQDRPPVSPSDSLTQSIANLVCAETWDGLRQLLDANPALMSVLGMSIVGTTSNSLDDSGDCSKALRLAHRLWVLKNCKKLGVNEGIELCKKVEGSDKPDQSQVMETFLITPSDAEADRLMKEASYLISAPAISFMKRITGYAEAVVPDYKSAASRRVALVERRRTQ